MSRSQKVVNELVVFGSHVDVNDPSNPVLGPRGQQRADFVGEYVWDNPAAFVEDEAKIVLLGGYAAATHGESMPDDDAALQSHAMRQALLARGVPERLMADVEAESTTALQGLANSIDQGYIWPRLYAQNDRRLGLVGSKSLVHRVGRLIHQFGFKDGAVELMGVNEGGLSFKTQELVLSGLYGVYMRNTSNIDQVLAQERQIIDLVSRSGFRRKN